jgi:hypothetical protein
VVVFGIIKDRVKELVQESRNRKTTHQKPSKAVG